jgi:hypothetical protein
LDYATLGSSSHYTTRIGTARIAAVITPNSERFDTPGTVV